MKQTVSESELAALAQQYREAAGKSRAQAARDMGVSQTSIFHAEESPHASLAKLRIKMIETYSNCQVEGPMYLLKKK